MSKNMPAPQDSEILIYQSDSGETRLEVRLQDETVWLTQKLMSELFQKDVRTINEHVRNTYEEGELEPEATIRKFRIVQTEGARRVRRLVDFYNLDMIISVGYRVKSAVATRFRQWATQRLREYLIKGFALDDERLKGRDRLADYFDELLARIREIRASEARDIDVVLDGNPVLEHPAVPRGQPEVRQVGCLSGFNYLLAPPFKNPFPRVAEITWSDDSGEPGSYRTTLTL